MDYSDRIKRAKENLQTAQNNKIRLEEKLNSYNKRLEELKNEMVAYNVSPETIVEEIDRLDDSIQKALKDVEEQLEKIEC